jgi:arsenate reductase (glutaredoxin)
MRLTLYGLSNCDTCKRARAWLGERGVAHEFHDFKKAGVPPLRLDAWIAALGWAALINRQGTTWRKLDVAAQAGVVDATTAAALMCAQPSLIKRPVLERGDGSVTVGFVAERWAALLERQ